MLNKIQQTVCFIEETIDFIPEIGIILGSGLGDLVDKMDVLVEMPYSEIVNFPVSTVEGHKGALIFGILGGKKVVAMQGRFHYYEGYSSEELVFPVRVMKFLGIKKLFVSNASGGLNPNFRVGDLMVITDHINLIPNPLIGANIDELGERFPSMTNAYSAGLIVIAKIVAKNEGIELREGCYIGLTGPTYETKKECQYLQMIGGDAVGMSTTPEVIVAAHMGLPVFGISVITNDGLSGVETSHEEVQIEGAKAAERMSRLFIEIFKVI